MTSFQDMEDVTAFFVRHMTMDQRERLMAERPLVYARLFPGASREVILRAVISSMPQGEPVNWQQVMS